jgi:hypothetical protein
MTKSPSSFITLTYDDEHYEPSLRYEDFQKFMRAVRYRFGPHRFFCAGEYGGQTGRPHFHAILFGLYFDDGKPIGKDICESKTLSELWTGGYASFGQVTYQSAAYVAGYCMKKIGEDPKAPKTMIDTRTGEIVEVEKEMAHMSLNPGIGASWFEKYWREVYLARDGCVLKGGEKIPAPKYYDRLLEKIDESLMEEKSFERYWESKRFEKDSTRERVKVRETVALARLRQKERGL